MLNRRFITWIALALLIGVSGYAYVNPAFAAKCKSVYSTSATWVRRQADTAEAAFKKTELYAAVKKRQSEQAAGKKSKPSPSAFFQRWTSSPKEPAVQQKSSGKSVAAKLQDARANWSAGQKIAHGHAFAKHGAEFGFRTESQMASHIDRVIGNASPSHIKRLARGRTAYWDDRTHSVVIVDPGSSDGGTAFKPQQGYPYFKSLK